MSVKKPTRLFAMLMSAASVSFLAACSQTGSASEGSGYERLTPNSKTRTFITQNDKQFRDQVAAHNLQCSKDKACR